MSVVTRHPRYAFLLFCVLLGTFFLLAAPSVPAGRLRPFGDLRRILHEEDMRYRHALKARADLVKKWGPTDDDVVSYVV